VTTLHPVPIRYSEPPQRDWLPSELSGLPTAIKFGAGCDQAGVAMSAPFSTLHGVVFDILFLSPFGAREKAASLAGRRPFLIGRGPGPQAAAFGKR
jgi:hypothetical protein